MAKSDPPSGCSVGQNYADHARDMGSDPQRQPPFFFTKPADAAVAAGDLIFTGTPAGVGPIRRGERVRGMIAGAAPVEVGFTLAPSPAAKG